MATGERWVVRYVPCGDGCLRQASCAVFGSGAARFVEVGQAWLGVASSVLSRQGYVWQLGYVLDRLG